MDLLNTCCSKDKKELSFPSFSVVFIHTFAIDSRRDSWIIESSEVNDIDYKSKMDAIMERIKDDPVEKYTVRCAENPSPVPVGHKAKNTSIAEECDMPIVKMKNEVEKLLFTESSLKSAKILRYSTKGFDFRVPVRSDVEYDDEGNIVDRDFVSVDFEGHANVEVSQFCGNIFSVTYRFLFDGNMCKTLEPDIDGENDNLEDRRESDRYKVEVATNHLISFLASYLGAEYWTSDPFGKHDKGTIDLKCRMIIRDFWLDHNGRYAGQEGFVPGDGKQWVITNEGDESRVFDDVALRYKKFLTRMFDPSVNVDDIKVNEDSRYAMVDIWESVKHPYGEDNSKDLFADDHDPALGEAGIVAHIRDLHKPELVGLMSMYPAEWPYREAAAYDDVCGDSIAIDVDDLVLAGSHMAVVIGTYARRGDGVNGVNWKKIMRERRLYHVSWEEYLLILQFVLAKKYTFNNAVGKLLRLTSNMSEVTKKMIGDCAKEALASSKKAIELDVIRHMKFPSHKLMYDRTMKRLKVDEEFERFMDVQEVVTGNLQSIGEYHAAKADYKINTALIAISVLSLFELLYQTSELPFVKFFLGRWVCLDGGWPAAILSALSGVAAIGGLGYVIYRFVNIQKNKND
jgi:hypothetical protein